MNLNITAAASFSGANAADFAIASGTTCTNGAAVTPNSTCVINVTFTPAAAWSRSAALNIADNAAGSPQAVALTGTGTVNPPAATVSPSTLTFSGQLVTTHPERGSNRNDKKYGRFQPEYQRGAFVYGSQCFRFRGRHGNHVHEWPGSGPECHMRD